MSAHQTHCCVLHGCKYGADSQCAVALGNIVQSYRCEWCEGPEGQTVERLIHSDYFKAAEPAERVFLAEYDPTKFPITTTTVDMVLVSNRPFPQVLLVKRKNYPYKGFWALPGGFVDPGETTEQAARRELREEAGLTTTTPLKLATVADSPDRDPRGRVFSIVYAAGVDGAQEPYPGDDAVEARWFPLGLGEVSDVSLAFDHSEILESVIWRKALFR